MFLLIPQTAPLRCGQYYITAATRLNLPYTQLHNPKEFHLTVNLWQIKIVTQQKTGHPKTRWLDITTIQKRRKTLDMKLEESLKTMKTGKRHKCAAAMCYDIAKSQINKKQAAQRQ